MTRAPGRHVTLSSADSKAFDVVGLGFNTIDRVGVVRHPPGVDAKQRLRAYLEQPGGQVPTALVALQRWGLRTAYVGPFGDDEGGRLQRDSLRREGVDCSGGRVRDGVGSQTSLILVDEVTGERTVLWQRPDGLALRADELDRAQLTAGRVLFLDADDADTALLAAGWARAAGVGVVLDIDEPGERAGAIVASSDAVIVSGSFPQRLTGRPALREALRAMCDMGPKLVAATLGGGGALACSGRTLRYQPAFRVPVVDTTSAGDLFHAGCLYGLLRAWPLADTLRFAAAAAALECTQLGGRAAIPALARVMEMAGTEEIREDQAVCRRHSGARVK